VSGPPPSSPSALVAGNIGRIMHELTLALRDARTALARETDPGRRAVLTRLIEDMKVRAAPVGSQYAKNCIVMALREWPSADDPGVSPQSLPGGVDLLGKVDLADLGLRLAEALIRFDPRIHGDEVARHEMLEVLISEFAITQPRPQA
jgi:hypothetical protein